MPCLPTCLLPVQACNNWGLVLQDLSSLRPPAERPAYLHHSLAKFRRAVRLRPDFDRACERPGLQGLRSAPPAAVCATTGAAAAVFVMYAYARPALPTPLLGPLCPLTTWALPAIAAGYNLGTVLYAHACSQQEALLASQEQAEAAQLAAAAGGRAAERRPASLALGSPTAARGSGQQGESERAIQATFAHAAQ